MSIREKRKQQTQLAFIEAALALYREKRSFQSISLRELSQRVGVVPSAFYRHFNDMQQLGHHLVDASALHLKDIFMHLIDHLDQPKQLVEFFIADLHDHSTIWQFIIGERLGSEIYIRQALEQEWLCLIEDLADHLMHSPLAPKLDQPHLQQWIEIWLHLSMSWAVQWLNIPALECDSYEALQQKIEIQFQLVFEHLNFTHS